MSGRGVIPRVSSPPQPHQKSRQFRVCEEEVSLHKALRGQMTHAWESSPWGGLRQEDESSSYPVPGRERGSVASLYPEGREGRGKVRREKEGMREQKKRRGRL